MNHPKAALVAGLSGCAVMALELTAVRLMAPYFGDSAYVWTNVIGVILVALALGAFLGGRMADAKRGAARLSWLFIGAGVLTMLVPLAVAPLGGWLVPSELPLDAAMGALVRGSLTATTLLFAPPVLLVGCVSPMLVAMLVSVDGKVGRASGLISAVATIGSLLGTFAATHLLIPYWGSRATIWVCGGLLLSSGLVCQLRWAGAAALLLPLPLVFLVGPIKSIPKGVVRVAEVESDYQFLQVVQRDWDGATQTALKINEGLDSFHSVAYSDGPYTHGSYYDFHVAAPFLVGDGVAPRGLKVLSLGEAAGTFGRLFAHAHKGCTFDAVEIDPAVTALGVAHFAGARPNGRTLALDARVFVDKTAARYDVVLVDAYAHQIYIPAHIASTEFFRGVQRVLEEGGVVSVNSGGIRFSDPVVQTLGATMAGVFGEAWAFRVPQSRNFVLMARKDRPLDPRHLGKVATDDATLRRILDSMAKLSGWRKIDAQEPRLWDDRPYLDVLQERAYSGGAQAASLYVLNGKRPVAEATKEVVSLLQQGRIEDALAAARTSCDESAMLRQLIGNARWLVRDTEGAVLEYVRSQELGMKTAGLASNLKYAREEVAGRRNAEAVGGRNGWLALGALLGLLAGTVVCVRRV